MERGHPFLRTKEHGKMSRRLDALYQARELVRQGNWVAYDAETTRLWGQVVSFAIVAPDGAILEEGLTKAAEPISPEAQAIHGIPDTDLENAPTFQEVWPQIAKRFEGKAAIVSYNAPFDASCLMASAAPYFSFLLTFRL
jgi:DNA polymerase III epsilon subunit-like protein